MCLQCALQWPMCLHCNVCFGLYVVYLFWINVQFQSFLQVCLEYTFSDSLDFRFYTRIFWLFQFTNLGTVPCPRQIRAQAAGPDMPHVYRILRINVAHAAWICDSQWDARTCHVMRASTNRVDARVTCCAHQPIEWIVGWLSGISPIFSGVATFLH